MFTKFFNEFQVGDCWASNGRTVTETDLVMFSALSGDWYPLHTDIEYAKSTPFKQRIAHGMLILSISTGLIEMEKGVVAAFYGIERLRFLKPTFINDTVSVKLEVVDLKEKENAGVITAKQSIFNQHGDVVIEGVLKILVNKNK
ncbi:MaoC/PaaZ C-terminal domain-containing protein [Bacillus solimangrovi]|uniref:Dehydratase n=1 Tax=Bacillus solimangrovi TaxID=1305675 RepID=A0A1E5LCN5_9BACI|nr:MaoC/PaaZ C-terminal domain-containing protein [Bacillus solimangrovi]OEH91834.1 dehydratase [Bacillus solimangrovi]